ncbi:hypothetical protein QFC22_003834 [Naganishia vaughanmartiniae]|uniref:Uncharacterized protein n=1 Tax=Naganishia vaughanmartiniae TaxID=1424756 RepID=A0ACC2X3J8_9TREE|nr:hypothetical protein QFC22_003834 [Naganishia vaughanmartiniae]
MPTLKEPISTEWQRLTEITEPATELKDAHVTYPEIPPPGIQAEDLGRRLEFHDLMPKGHVHHAENEEGVFKLFWQLRERLGFHLQKAIREGRTTIFRFYDSSNSICEFSLQAALRLAMSFTVTEDLIEFLISPYTGFQTETVESVDGETLVDQDEDIADRDVTVLSVHQSREWISTGISAQSKLPEEMDLKDQTKKHPVLLHEKDCIIGSDPMTNNKLQSDNDRVPDIFPFRAGIINPSAKNHHLRINAIKGKVVTSLKQSGMPSLKQQNLKTVFAEIDGYQNYGSGIVLAHTISKMRANPGLLLFPAVAKVKGRTPYQLSNQKALFDPEEADYKLGKATVIAWFRVLEFLEEELVHLASGKANRGESPAVLFCDICSFEDHPVPDIIVEEWLQSGLYTSADSVVISACQQAEKNWEWDKLFFMAFGRRVGDV